MLVAPASSLRLVVDASCLTVVSTWSTSKNFQTFTSSMEVIAS